MSTENSSLARIPSFCHTVASFVNNLPKVSCADLSFSSEKECCICCEDFEGPDDGEKAVKLPCGHVFGEKCLLLFLSSRATLNNCPMCRAKLPHLADYASGRDEDYACFLSWIALRYPHRGAALDRKYAVMKAIDQANFYLKALSQCYHPQDGALDVIDERYISLMHEIADLDPQSPASWEILEIIQEGLDPVMQDIELMDRSNPHQYLSIPQLRPGIGRRVALTNFVLETETPLTGADIEDSDLEDGELPSEGLIEIVHGATGAPVGPITEAAPFPIESTSFPAEIREALQEDFAGIPTADIFETLRSRRFAFNLPCRFSHLHDGDLLERLAAWLYVSDEIIAEYTLDTAFREREARPESHWQMNAAGTTLEYAVEYY